MDKQSFSSNNLSVDRFSMNKIDELLTRGVEKIYPSKEELEKVLRSGKKLRVYEGFDPTSPQLHIGHMAGLRKLRQWQDLGHEVIFLIGDFTGMIGDPTGKYSKRKILTRDEVLENAKTYKQQASKILRFEGKNPIKIKYNSEWLGKLSTLEFLRLSHYVTAQQVVERDMFQKRIKQDQDVFMNEFFYPFLQGYDSVAMDVDLEIGGNDQMFNMMMGRDLMHKIKRKNKFVMTTPLLTDSQGNKIGKTEGNVIALTAKPVDFYGMIMNLGDDVIVKCFEYLTDMPMEDVQSIARKIEAGENPMIHKKKLAYILTMMLNDEKAAREAQEEFEKSVQNKETPSKLEIKIVENIKVSDDASVLVESSLVKSKSEAKRLIEQRAIDINGKTITYNSLPTVIGNNSIVKVGKRKFVKIQVR